MANVSKREISAVASALYWRAKYIEDNFKDYSLAKFLRNIRKKYIRHLEGLNDGRKENKDFFQ